MPQKMLDEALNFTFILQMLQNYDVKKALHEYSWSALINYLFN